MPRRTPAVLASLSSCAMAAFPVLKPGRRSHHMISGPAQCSFPLRPARSLTPFKGAFPSRASGVSLPPRPPRLLPARAKFAGWVFSFDSPTGVLHLSHGALQQSPRWAGSNHQRARGLEEGVWAGGTRGHSRSHSAEPRIGEEPPNIGEGEIADLGVPCRKEHRLWQKGSSNS
jgi:hypothetical protein